MALALIPSAARADVEVEAADTLTDSLLSGEVGKSQYWLLAPTPTWKMRALAPGETPFTVDAGHVQVELTAADVKWEPGVQTTTLGALNAKFGITNRADLQLVYTAFQQVRTDDQMTTLSGHGDAELRVKVNALRPDGGAVAFAISPYVRIPTSGAMTVDGYEGGCRLPVAIASIGAGFALTMVPHAAFVHDGAGAMQPAGDVTLSLTHPLTERVGSVLEHTTAYSADGELGQSVHAGLTIGATRDMEIDTGVYLDATALTESINPYVVVTFRR